MTRNMCRARVSPTGRMPKKRLHQQLLKISKASKPTTPVRALKKRRFNPPKFTPKGGPSKRPPTWIRTQLGFVKCTKAFELDCSAKEKDADIFFFTLGQKPNHVSIQHKKSKRFIRVDGKSLHLSPHFFELQYDIVNQDLPCRMIVRLHHDSLFVSTSTGMLHCSSVKKEDAELIVMDTIKPSILEPILGQIKAARSMRLRCLETKPPMLGGLLAMKYELELEYLKRFLHNQSKGAVRTVNCQEPSIGLKFISRSTLLDTLRQLPRLKSRRKKSKLLQRGLVRVQELPRSTAVLESFLFHITLESLDTPSDKKEDIRALEAIEQMTEEWDREPKQLQQLSSATNFSDSAWDEELAMVDLDSLDHLLGGDQGSTVPGLNKNISVGSAENHWDVQAPGAWGKSHEEMCERFTKLHFIKLVPYDGVRERLSTLAKGLS